MKWAVAASAIALILITMACTSEAGQHYERAVDLAEQGKWQEAIGEYDKAIELEPSDPTLLMGAYLMRGRAYDALGDHERAIDDFDTIIEEAAGPPEFLASVYKERGEAYDALGDVQRAIADLEKALSLTNDSSLATQIEQLIEGLAGH